MPAQPHWISHLDNILEALRALPRPYVDRLMLEKLLGVGRRRAQQILAPCVTERVGSNGLADREQLIAHLEKLARQEEVSFEQRRRQRVAEAIWGLRKQRLEQPEVPVEAPTSIVNQRFDSLPPGVRLGPGRITVEFAQPEEALEKLLALAMAAGNDWERFRELTGS